MQALENRLVDLFFDRNNRTRHTITLVLRNADASGDGNAHIAPALLEKIIAAPDSLGNRFPTGTALFT